MNNSPSILSSRSCMGCCGVASLFIVQLFLVSVSYACTLSMLALLVEKHTFKTNVEWFWL